MVMRRLALVLVCALAGCGGDDDGNDPRRSPQTKLIDQLNALEGVTATEMGHFTDGSIVYDLHIVQPVDHALLTGATFEQRVILRYNGRLTGPTVMITDGYALQYYDEVNNRIAISEPTAMLGASQVEVEHRYFATSIPATPDWSRLTIAQAAADHHHIHDLLAPLFVGPWVATGASKSGMAALYYRHFYPDDVVATVAYVAPLMHSRGDPRFGAFLAQVGDTDCRSALLAMQRAALDDTPRGGAVTSSRRDALVAAFGERYGSANLTLIGDDYAYEIAVVDAPFYFWQYSDPALCAEVPDDQTPDDVFLDFLDEVSGFGGLTNHGVVALRPFRYQSQTQLGTPGVDTSAIADLLHHGGDDADDVQLPDTVIPEFDPAPMQQVESWATTASSRVMMIYGAYDPWTAGALTLSGDDRLTLTAPTSNHGAHIADLASDDLRVADAALARWVGVSIDTRYRTALTLAAPARRELLLRR